MERLEDIPDTLFIVHVGSVLLWPSGNNFPLFNTMVNKCQVIKEVLMTEKLGEAARQQQKNVLLLSAVCYNLTVKCFIIMRFLLYML